LDVSVRAETGSTSGRRRPSSAIATAFEPAGSEPARSVHISIARLELHGIPAERRYAIANACERELARLFTADAHVAAPLGSGKFVRSAVAPFHGLTPPDAIGVAIARAVANELRRPGNPSLTREDRREPQTSRTR
jgi:hypothetical protein